MGALSTLLPLFVLLTVVGIAAFIGYQMYLWTNELADQGKRTMEKKHVSFTKDGMKVGVKELGDEEYADRTQSYLVKAWNYSSFPGYKSRIWNTEPTAGTSAAPKGQKTRSTSSASGVSVPKGARTSRTMN